MKKTNIIFIIIIALIVSGCNPNSNFGGKTSALGKDKLVDVNEGVSFKFNEDTKLSQIYDGGVQSFNLRFDIENKGEFTIPKNELTVRLGGIRYQDLNINENAAKKNVPKDIRKARKNTEGKLVLGDKEIVSFGPLKYMPKILTKSSQRIHADVCYPYQTNSIVELCVATNQFEQQTSENLNVCKVENKNPVLSTGAPVKVTQFEQRPISATELEISFTIEHVGKKTNSIIFKSDTLRNCLIQQREPTANFDQKNKVKYSVDNGGIGKIDCDQTGKNNGEVTLISNKAAVFCIQKLQAKLQDT